MPKKVPLRRIVDFRVGPVPGYGIILMQPSYLEPRDKSVADARTGLNYSMSPAQVEALIALLQHALATVQADPAGPPMH